MYTDVALIRPILMGCYDAARQNKSAIAKLLLDYKADVNAGTAF